MNATKIDAQIVSIDNIEYEYTKTSIVDDVYKYEILVSSDVKLKKYKYDSDEFIFIPSMKSDYLYQYTFTSDKSQRITLIESGDGFGTSNIIYSIKRFKYTKLNDKIILNDNGITLVDRYEKFISGNLRDIAKMMNAYINIVMISFCKYISNSLM